MRPHRLAPALLLALAACGGGGHDDHAGGGGDARVVELTADDRLRFDPATVQATAGERVTFRVRNTGTVRHEFVIGDAAYHDEHKAKAATPGAEHGDHGGGDAGTAVEVGPGETKTVTYTLPGTAPAYACYVDRHDQAGMTGRVSYAS